MEQCDRHSSSQQRKSYRENLNTVLEHKRPQSQTECAIDTTSSEQDTTKLQNAIDVTLELDVDRVWIQTAPLSVP